MYTPSSRSVGKGDGGERLDVPGNLGGIMSEIQHQLTVLARQMWHLHYALQIVSGNEWRRPQTPLLYKQPGKPKKSGETGGKFKSGKLACLPRTQVVETQEQGEAAGYVLLTRPSGGPDYRREPTRRELLDGLGQNNNADRAEDTFGGEESDVPVGFNSAEDKKPP